MEERIRFLEASLTDRDEHIRQVVEAAKQAAIADAAAGPQPQAAQVAQAVQQAAIQEKR